jgi:hypothetical protein
MAGSGSSSSGSSTAPTWSSVYMNDLTQKTCNAISGCHNEWSSASSAYQYLQAQGCLPALNCITGFGAPGNMPLFGTLSSTAKADLQAWIAAGSPMN